MRSKHDIQTLLDKLTSDDRLSDPPANVFINAPLALIQLELEAKITILKWVLSGKEHSL